MNAPEPNETALLIDVPVADPVLGEFRARLDRAAELGVPAHITVLSPFLPFGQLDDASLREVQQLAAGTPAFTVTLASIAWFGDAVVYAAPDPAEPIRALTEAVVAAFPAYPPYGGAYDDVVPHLTIGHLGSPAELDEAGRLAAARLPIEQRVEALSLWAGSQEPSSWRRIRRFPLGADV